MRKRNAVLFVATCAVLMGCMKEELPVPKAPRGDAATHQLCMGSGYSQQLWLKISSGARVSENVRTAWDLAFESAPDGWRVMLNGSRLMTAWDLGAVDITAVQDTIGMAAGKRIDAPSGHRDSTAIGDWRVPAHVFLLDLGYDALGQHQGFVKLRFAGVSSTAYTFERAALDGSGFTTVSLAKDPTREFTCFSIANGVLPIEPPIGTWDLCFTSYTHQFYEPFLPYLVNGVLIPEGVRVAQVDGRDFSTILLEDTLAFPFEERRNTIGYDWKTYSFDSGSYIIRSDRAYIVEDAQGYFFKLRFVDFYGDLGQAGCPKFEVVPL